MVRKKVHIVYEYGVDFRPHGSAFIRLLRPLTYPSLQEKLQVSYGADYEGQQVDVVILDRTWRPDVTLKLVKKLVDDIHQIGAKLIYSLDDSFLDLSFKHPGWSKELIPVVEFLSRQANGLLVTTEALKERYKDFNTQIAVLPNALDERLLVPKQPGSSQVIFPRKRKIIGFMGTNTHDDDLIMIIPALKTVWQRNPQEIGFQMVGGIGHANTCDLLKDLPIQYINPQPGENEYPLFMLWFTSRINWDIAIAPLRETVFNSYKSDIKFLDYCAVGTAGIYSRVQAYQSIVRHLETGWLVENQIDAWVNAFETLLNDDQMRINLAKNAQYYLFSERILARNIKKWQETLDWIFSS